MEQSNTWTLKVELTVFAGDMSKEEVISNAQKQLESMTDGSDFMGVDVEDAIRDVV